MKVAAAYIRVSTDDQLEYSPDSQLSQIRRYAKNNDFVLPEEYIFVEEEGRSGRNSAKRPEFMRMIATAKKNPKPFDAILVWKFSRFARNRQDSIVYKSMLRKELGIDVISVSEYIGDDKISIITEAIIEAMDEYYSVNLAEEVTRGMTEKAHRGEPLTYAPFGYRIENKQYLPDPDTAALVQMIYSDFLGGMGYMEIAHKLNDLGVRTRFGNRMENRNIEYILKNPVYIGKIHWNPSGKVRRSTPPKTQILADGQPPPLISQEDFEAVQQRMAQIKQLYHQKAKSRVKPANEYALRGLVRCSSCGSTLVISSPNQPSAYLQCNRYAKGSCATSHAINLVKITDWVMAAIQTDLENETFELHIRQTAARADTSSVLRAQIEREKSKLERIREAYEAGIDTLEEYRRNKEKLTANIEKLTLQLPQLPDVRASRKAFADKVRSLLPSLLSADTPPSEKNRLLRSFVEKIVFDWQADSIEIYYYIQ